MPRHVKELDDACAPLLDMAAKVGARVWVCSEYGHCDVARFELYSCFPIAVRVQARELGVAPGRRLTVSGGMAFAGGPLNNFVFQSLVRMVEALRRDRRGAGMVTAVSGMLTKQGVSLWSAMPPTRPFAYDDVTAVRVATNCSSSALVSAFVTKTLRSFGLKNRHRSMFTNASNWPVLK